jgi:hypothetical protein
LQIPKSDVTDALMCEYKYLCPFGSTVKKAMKYEVEKIYVTVVWCVAPCVLAVVLIGRCS